MRKDNNSSKSKFHGEWNEEQVKEIENKIHSLNATLAPYQSVIEYAIKETELYSKQGKNDIDTFYQEQLVSAIINTFIREEFSKNRSQKAKDQLIKLYEFFSNKFRVHGYERVANSVKSFQIIFDMENVVESDSENLINEDVLIKGLLSIFSRIPAPNNFQNVFSSLQIEFDISIYAITTYYAIKNNNIDVRRGKRIKAIRSFLMALKPEYSRSLKDGSIKQFSQTVNKFEITDFRETFEKEHQDKIRLFLSINGLSNIRDHLN